MRVRHFVPHTSAPRVASALPVVAVVGARAFSACTRSVAAPPPSPAPAETVIAARARGEMKDGASYQVTHLVARGDSLFAERMAPSLGRFAVASRDVSMIRSLGRDEQSSRVISGFVLGILILVLTGSIAFEK